MKLKPAAPAHHAALDSAAFAASADVHRRPRYARWRALSLSLVYVAFAAHVIHWKVTGRSLTPLELNEVMYTLELGIITAGFLFMCLLVAGTLVFGRFFCSWACHIMVLQDLCAWLLRRFGLRPKPVRSRLLLWVAPLTAMYMFVWPQIVRTWYAGSLPTFHLATDRDGWASFVTNHFWRNLPGPGIIVVTFLVCGFLIVYLLGSRSFCTYVCPYGAVFGLADRFALGRIRVNANCIQCGRCTAACTSHIRVHVETRRNGMVVNPACLKDLDCVGVCPQGALSYRFGVPALWKSVTTGRFGLPFDFSWAEELLGGVICVFTVLALRGLYGLVPFLLSLALGVIFGHTAIVTLRMIRQPNVALLTFPLKRCGEWRPLGWAFVGCSTLLAAFLGHSGFVRYHEYIGLTQTNSLDSEKRPERRRDAAQGAFGHLRTAYHWSLFANARVESGLVIAATELKLAADVVRWSEAFLHRHEDERIRFHRAWALATVGRPGEAEHEYRVLTSAVRDAGAASSGWTASAHEKLAEMRIKTGDFQSSVIELRKALEIDPNRASAHAAMGSCLAELGRWDEAISHLQRAQELAPEDPRVSYNLGTLLSFAGRFDEAVRCYVRALQVTPDDVDLRNNLGFALLRTGRHQEALAHLEHAVAVDASHAGAHYNLAVCYATAGFAERAEAELLAASRLDARYARVQLPR